MNLARYSYEEILDRLQRQWRSAIYRQVIDPGRPDHGAFIHKDHGMASASHTGSAHDLAIACYLFLAPGSAYCGDEELFQRIQPAIAYQRRAQRPSGLIDLESVNWESPPDTAFTVQLLAPIVEMARKAADDPKARWIALELGEYIFSAALGIINRGFHTPNHRWVVCSALAQAMALFPPLIDAGARRYLDSILAEGIDINDDGEYSERSTGVYNAVCNRSLRLIADYLDMPWLLEPVRRNLDMMCHLLDADGSVVTLMSTRQDYRQRVVPVSMADSFFDMAQRDGNGMWAAAADLLVSRGVDQHHSAWLIHPFLSRPEYRGERLPRTGLPTSFRKLFPASKLWRVREGALSATAVTASRAFFSLRYGDVHLEALKISGTYHGTTHFAPDTVEELPTGIRLVHRGSTRPLPGYELPLGRPIPWGAFPASRAERERWTLPPMDIVVDIEEVESGFDLRLRTFDGLQGVTFQVECCFEGPGEWETQDQVIKVAAGQTAILKSGYGTFHRGDFGISVGPGGAGHRMWHMRGTDPEPGFFRVLISLVAPLDHTIRLRYGRWSPASSQLVPDSPEDACTSRNRPQEKG